MLRAAVRVLALQLLLFSAACAAPAAAPPSGAAGAVPAAQASAPAAGAPVPTAAPTSVGSVRAAYTLNSMSLAPLWLADEQGLWKQQGLDVDLLLISGAPTAIAAMLAGEVQFVNAQGEATLSAQVREPELVGIANWIGKTVQRLITRPEITRPEELRGKRIGVFTIGDGHQVIWSKALTFWGLDPQRDVVYAGVGGGNMAAFVAGLQAGAIDGAMFVPPADALALRNGGRLLANVSDLNVPQGGIPVFARRPTLEGQRPQAEAYLQGLVDGVRMFYDDPVLTKATIARHMQIDDPSLVDASYEVYASTRALIGRPFIDLAVMRAVIETVAEENPDVRTVDPERVYDNSILQALDARGLLPPP